MRRIKTYWVFLSLSACIGTDFEPLVDPILRVSEGLVELFVTESHELKAEYFDHRGILIDTSFSWTSSNNSVVSVDESGSLIALNEGIATVQVGLGALKDEVRILVRSSNEAISIIVSEDTLEVGAAATFRAEYTDVTGINSVNNPVLIWSTKNDGIVNVSSNGSVRGLSAGKTYVYCGTENVIDSIQVLVIENSQPLPRQIAITQSISELLVGSTYQFAATVFDETGLIDSTVSIAWSSSNSEVLRVNSNGVVFASSQGTSTVTATVDDLRDEIEVTVLPDEEDIQEEIVREGTLAGRGGYDISGDFSLVQNETGLVLILENPGIDPSAPGPYYYLTNRENAVAGGINLGKADPSITRIVISEDFPTATINDYDYLMVWCEPFSVTLGVGKFSD